MMRKRLNLLLILICLLNVIFIFTVAFNARPARAATKKVYKSEVVSTGSIQATLDQRAAEGWQLVAASAHSTSTNTDVTVLIFEKQWELAVCPEIDGKPVWLDGDFEPGTGGQDGTFSDISSGNGTDRAGGPDDKS